MAVPEKSMWIVLYMKWIGDDKHLRKAFINATSKAHATRMVRSRKTTAEVLLTRIPRIGEETA